MIDEYRRFDSADSIAGKYLTLRMLLTARKLRRPADIFSSQTVLAAAYRYMC
jgi:hypothetical protein